MKTAKKIFLGLFLILMAVFFICEALGVIAPLSSIVGEISIIKVIVGIAFICMTISELAKLRFFMPMLYLSFIFMLFEKNIAFILGLPNENIISNWVVFGCAALAGVGLEILMPKRRKKFVKRDGHIFYENESESSLVSSVRYIDCENFHHMSFENNLGSTVINFENIDKYEGGGEIFVENNLGSMTICVPSEWCVTVEIENSLGHIAWPNGEEMNHEGKHLKIAGENNLGSMTVKLV